VTEAAPSKHDRISLLWPAGARAGRPAAPALTGEAAADLGLPELVAALSAVEQRWVSQERRQRVVRQTLLDLCADPETILYRQAVVADLVADPDLRQRLTDSLPGLEALSDTLSPELFRPGEDASVQRIAGRLAALELLVDVAQRLAAALDAATVQSTALAALRAYLRAMTASTAFVALRAELPRLREVVSQVRSVTVGVNLTPDLLPESATILALNPERVQGRRTLLGRLLGSEDDGVGLAPLHRARDGGLAGQPNDVGRDLGLLLRGVVAPVAEALERYAVFAASPLAQLGPELAVLLGGARLVERMRGLGLPMCRPRILPVAERTTVLADCYNVALALRMGAAGGEVVPNDVRFDADSGRVWILTGPNRSGKTTYLGAVALAHVLAQAGLFVPARDAALSPADALFVHFPARERGLLGMGRLDEEASRIAAIFRQATPQSVVLLNEALAGTSSVEGLALARDAVRGLRLLGARAVYVTHLHELALAAADINASTPGHARVASLVAEAPTPDAPRTFRVRPGAPGGWSYASEIAAQHGISYAQLAELLRDRGFL
jgi:DNA mismatch repair protein MutS